MKVERPRILTAKGFSSQDRQGAVGGEDQQGIRLTRHRNEGGVGTHHREALTADQKDGTAKCADIFGFRWIHLDDLPAKNPVMAKVLDESAPLKTLEKRRGCP
jgi:hypothetical protein